MSETTLLQFSIFCFTLSLLLDLPLLHTLWRLNATWAQQRGTPRRLVDVLSLWRWTWSVLIFDPSPQVTRPLRLLAAASGGLRVLALLVLMSISDLTPRPFAHRKRGGGPCHAHATLHAPAPGGAACPLAAAGGPKPWALETGAPCQMAREC